MFVGSANNAPETVTPIQVGWLLDAVRHVKSQKQRPDRERICHYIQQHHDLTSETVSLLLDSAVKNGILTTTITRGNTEKLTYVITTSENTSRETSSKPASTVKIKVSATQNSANNDNAAPHAEDSDDKKLLHNKSDISHYMVKAVKGEQYYYY